jgi:D-alanine--poly(phosphoribitol) ligase subunit 1
MTFISNMGLAFREIANRFANRVALRYPERGETVSYAQLATLTDRWAGVLWARGLRKGQVVAFFHDKSPDAFAAMLACLRLGVMYSNLDPDSPWERIRKMLTNCAPDLLINAFEDLPFAAELSGADALAVLHLRTDAATTSLEALPDEGSVQGGNPAYIMFTSGSTGIPKGAVMSHANLLWFTQWARDRFSITPDDVLTNVNPIYFDNSVFDFYTAIFSGASLVPLTPSQVKDARSLVRLVEAAKCTVWFSVPSLLVYLLTTRAIGKDNFLSVRKFIFGGEGFPKPKLKQLFELYGNRADLENVYGPTECTCICSARTINARDFDDMLNLAALGPVAQNFGFEILPLDVANPNFGELFLKGPQVGLGYFRDPDRTSKAFVQNPTHQHYADVGYKTGDLVERDVNGWLYFKGRADFQIKHMGYRIELEEVEAALATLTQVRECAVVYQKFSAGMGQIVSFVACSSNSSSEELSMLVSSILPPYMVPKRFVLLEELPKNANGKIDRVALEATL